MYACPSNPIDIWLTMWIEGTGIILSMDYVSVCLNSMQSRLSITVSNPIWHTLYMMGRAKTSEDLTLAGFSSIADPLPLSARVMSWASGVKLRNNFVGSPGTVFRQEGCETFCYGTNFSK